MPRNKILSGSVELWRATNHCDILGVGCLLLLNNWECDLVVCLFFILQLYFHAINFISIVLRSLCLWKFSNIQQNRGNYIINPHYAPHPVSLVITRWPLLFHLDQGMENYRQWAKSGCCFYTAVS